MKNLFLEKNIVQKLIIAIVIIILFNFVSPTVCNANNLLLEGAVVLLGPIVSFIIFIFDSIMEILQVNLIDDVDYLVGAEAKEFRDTTGGWIDVLQAAGVIILGITIITVTVLAAPVGIGMFATIAVAGGVTLTFANYEINSAIENFEGEYVIPQLKYSPFAIFSNMVPMLDINFFNPKTIETEVSTMAEELDESKKQRIKDNCIQVLEGATEEELLTYAADIADWSCKIIITEPYDLDKDTLETNLLDNTYADSNLDIVADWIDYGLLQETSYTQNVLANYLSYYGFDEKFDEENSITPRQMIYVTCWASAEAQNGAGYSKPLYEQDYSPITVGETYDESYYYGDLFSRSGFYDYEMYHLSSYFELFIDTEYEKVDDWEDASITYFLYSYKGENGLETFRNEIIELYENTVAMLEEKAAKEKEQAEQEAIANGARDYSETTAPKKLRETIAGWYNALRNLALVCLLVIIVYIGIRIILSSTAPEKAKYKQMIVNWVVALCILFLLHVIMIATLTITEKITEALAGNCAEVIVLPLPGSTTEIDGENVEDQFNGDDDPVLVTNFVGYIRYMQGIYSGKNDGDYSTKSIGFMVMYVMLVVQTLMFTWVYLKRVVYMAFLTIISPLVAITYPIDKIGDGKAQAFDMWLKEYIFNALLQPIHLLIYTVLCGVALELVIDVPIYGIVCLAFVVPAEKFIRKMFGFEKAQTPSALSGAAGAALAMSGIQRLGNMIRPDGKDDSGTDDKLNKPKIRTKDDSVQEQMKTDAESAKNKAAGVRMAGQTGRDISGGNAQQSAFSDSDSSEGSSVEPEIRTANPEGDTTGTKAEMPQEAQPVVDTHETQTSGEEQPSRVSEDGKSGDEPVATEKGTESGENNTQSPKRFTARARDKISGMVDKAKSGTNKAKELMSKEGIRQLADKSKDKVREAKEAMSKTKLAKARNRMQNTRLGRTFNSLGGMQRRNFKEWNSAQNWRKRRRKIRRKIAGAYIGAGGAILMASIKAATGSSANEVATAATAGGAAGYAIGSKGAQKIQEFENSDERREAIKDGWYTPEERAEKLDKQARKEKKQAVETQQLLREKIPNEEDREEMLKEGGWLDYCWNHGVSDMEEAVASYEYYKEAKEKYVGNGITTDEQKAVALTSFKQWKRSGHMIKDPEKWRKWQALRAKDFMNSEVVQQRAQQGYNADVAKQKEEAARIDQDAQALDKKMSEDAQYVSLEESSKAAETEIEKINKDIAEQDAIITAGEQELAQLAALKAKKEQELEFYEHGDWSSDIDGQISELQAQLKNLKGKNNKTERDRVNRELDSLRRKRKELESQATNTMANLDLARKKLQSEIDALNGKVIDAKDKKTTQAAKVETQRAVIAQFTEYRATHFSEELSRIEARRAENNKPLETVESRAERIGREFARAEAETIEGIDEIVDRVKNRSFN